MILVASVAILVVAYISQLFLPWWIIAVVCFVACAATAKGLLSAFLTASLPITLLWAVLSFLGKMSLDNVLYEQIKLLLGNSVPLVVIVTALTGGIFGGVAGLAGFFIRDMGNLEESNFSPL